MNNYYEILEVSQKASPEIIEKAYKLLAKKYHPDMHEEEKKEWAESEFKKINEAYEILSDEEKRKQYDITLQQEKDETYNNLIQEIEALKKELKQYKEKETDINISPNIQNEYDKQKSNSFYNDTTNSYYHNVYKRQYNSSVNNNNNYQKENWLQTKIREIICILLTIIIVLAISYLLWKIPFTKNWLQEIYNENQGIRMIVDVFIE